MSSPSYMLMKFPFTFNGNVSNMSSGRNQPPPWTADDFMALTIASNIRITFCILALLANGLVILLQLKLKRFLETSFVFPLSLSFADLLHSIGVFLETYTFKRKHISKMSLLVFSILATSGHFQSYVSVTLVAVDRYLALCAFPIRYKSIVSLKKYYFISAMGWCLSFTHGITVRYFFPPGHKFGSLETFITPSVAVIVCGAIYLKLYISTSRSMQRTMGHVDRDEVICRAAKQSRKLLIAILLILLTNVVLLMPSRIFNLYLSLEPIYFQRFKNILWVNIFYNLQTFNAVMNPLIYWRHVLLEDIPQCQRGCFQSSTVESQTAVINLPSNQDVETGTVNVAMETA